MPPTTPTPQVAEYVEDVTGENADTIDVHGIVPVTVVDPVRVEDRKPRTLTTGVHPLTADVAARIAGETPSRSRLVITNTGAATGYVGNAGVSAGTGFPIAVGESLTIEAACEVWALGATTLAVLAEFHEG